MNPYFICSLPRSRTAWLANFLSYGPSHCYHEPYNQYDPADLPNLFRSANRHYVGVSDSLNTLLITELLLLFPEAKIILIRRPIAEVDRSMNELGFPCKELLEQMNKTLNLIVAHYQPLVVNFHDFNAVDIWNFIVPEMPVNLERTRMLESFNVTVQKPIIIKKAQELVKKCSQRLPEVFGGEKIR